MASARELATLRGLQSLREKRSEGEFVTANMRLREAEKSHARSSLELDRAAEDLDRTVGGSQLGLGRLLLLAAHVSHLERATTTKRIAVSDAEDVETAARTAWYIAQRRRELLDEQAGVEAREERRKTDEKRERDALTRHILRTDAAQ